MKIREADNKDIVALKKLWKVSFNEKNEYIDSYYQNSKKGLSKTYLVEVNKEIVSMVDILEVSIKLGNNTSRGIYFYACATDPKFRGKGLMHTLIDFCCKKFMCNGYKFACLVPQTRSLFSFYQKQLFTKIVYRREMIIDLQETNSINHNKINTINDENSFIKLKKTFEHSYKNSILHTDDFISLIYKQTYISEGSILNLNNNYAICFKRDEDLLIEELSSHSETYYEDIKKCMVHFKCKKAVIYGKGNNAKPYALIKNLSRSEDNFYNIYSDIYINTMLD